MTGVFTCLKCQYFKGLNADGTVECERLGDTKPKIICPLFKPACRTWRIPGGVEG